MKLRLLGCAIFGALLTAAPSLGAAPPIVAKALGLGTIKSGYTIAVKPGAMIVDKITIAPGGDFGWHTHGSPVAVTITSGTLTVFDKTVANCVPFHVSKGQSFFEPANHLHRAVNLTSKPVTLYAIYLGVPKGAAPNAPGTQPAGCTTQ
jgi:quercetin dioxygenase-like cupin family protein